MTHVNYYEKPVPQRKRSISGTKLILLEVMKEKSVIPKWVARIFCKSNTCINGFTIKRGICKWIENMIIVWWFNCTASFHMVLLLYLYRYIFRLLFNSSGSLFWANWSLLFLIRMVLAVNKLFTYWRHC